ncbi:probable RNA polymerase II nuclear localization protein SLC7A6OS [Scaptodrosophila lebanonensis]|uniref:Probable RNA polymerase II nuclear localization protein SLC7A6OS n=1 Tax=Drosophila lebanonensis TaxID=7225 RepID=A0A6J2TYF2_DROLE|nr:probable RNA polymerase II nuclear localization protein SLC7A6OS [Scaptodrosophila lebanonensis]
MPAVVRIKRRIDEEPHTAFVLNGKRRRLQEDESESTPDKEKELLSTFRFAGTLENQDDCATKQFAAARLNKASAKELVQQKSGVGDGGVNRREKLRQQTQQAAREQRFRVVNCLRTTLDDQNANETDGSGEQKANSATTVASASNTNSQITIVDIESQETPTTDAQNSQLPADSDIGYVYDLYVPENEQQAAVVDMMDDNYLSIFRAGEVIFEDSYNDDDEEFDSEDSNQENYYTNDYPDDDEFEQADSNFGDLCEQMHKFVLDEDEEDKQDDDEFLASSEDEDYNTFQDPYVHTIDTDAAGFVDDIDFCNVDNQGSAYERYKRRLLREAEGLEHCSDSDDDDANFESASEHSN